MGLLLAAASLQLAVLSAAEPERRMHVVGHRGLLTHAPENTLAGFRACLTLRVGFEFDVRRTRDGRLVCLHDATLDRTTDGAGRLDAISLAEARRLGAGSWFDPAFRDEKLPSLEEIFPLLAAHGQDATLAAVDLKEVGDGVEAEVVALAKRSGALPRLVFIGATIESAEVRARLRKASAEASLARLAATADDVAAVLEDPLADWVYVRFLPSAELVARAHGAKKRIFLAGPLVAGREEANWAAAAELGLDAVLTDHPLACAALLRQRTAAASSAGDQRRGR